MVRGATPQSKVDLQWTIGGNAKLFVCFATAHYHYYLVVLFHTTMQLLFLIISAMMAEHHSVVNAWQWAYFKSPKPFHHRRNNCVGERTVMLEHVHVRKKSSLQQNNFIKDDGSDSSYQTSASVIKGIVSSLTSLTNAIFQTAPTTTDESSNSNSISSYAPTSPHELLTKISNDYTINNYLWTGKLDTSCFISNCTFTDPTLSFVGVDKYIKNVHNLLPIVNYLLGNDNDDDEQQQSSSSRSDLLSITINETDQYIETRWNMVGNFTKLFWKPRIDVIGRTKFWYQQILPPMARSREQRIMVAGDDTTTTTSSTEEEELVYYYQVYLYDEQWEIPAGLALLQLVTKAGTIPNTNKQ
jgi:hypothetical protein